MLCGMAVVVADLMRMEIAKERRIKMAEKLLSMFTDKTGKTSMMRLMVMFVIIIYMITWSRLCIAEGNLIAIDWQQAATIIGALFAKAYQAGNEGK